MDGGLCDELHKHHYVSENYKESVFRREKIMATDLGNNIAIPHGSEKEIIIAAFFIIIPPFHLYNNLYNEMKQWIS